MTQEIPLIDLSPFWSSKREAAETKHLLQSVDSALKETGFLCITGTPLLPSYIENAQAVAQSFFDLPLEEKMKSAAIKFKSRGYTALGEQGLSYAMDADDLKQNTAQPADLFEHDLSGIETELGVLHIEGLQGLDDDLGDGQVTEPLLVGRDDEPGGPLRAAFRQGLFIGLHIILPQLALLEVLEVHLPILCRIGQPLLEPLLLLVFADMQKEFQDRDSVIR